MDCGAQNESRRLKGKTLGGGSCHITTWVWGAVSPESAGRKWKYAYSAETLADALSHKTTFGTCVTENESNKMKIGMPREHVLLHREELSDMRILRNDSKTPPSRRTWRTG